MKNWIHSVWKRLVPRRVAHEEQPAARETGEPSSMDQLEKILALLADGGPLDRAIRASCEHEQDDSAN